MQRKEFDIIPLDVNNEYHIDFTYEILVKRFSVDHINISDMELPTRAQHIDIITSGRFYCYYIGTYYDIPFCTIYVITNNFEGGFFLNPTGWKKMLSKYRKELKEQVSYFPKQFSAGQKIAAHQIYAIFKLMMNAHPDLNNKITARINYNNKLSQLTAKTCKFSPAFITYNYNG